MISLDWFNSLVVSGDRNGTTNLYDINTGQNICSFKKHNSPVHKIALWGDGDNNLIITGGVGSLAIMDMRTNSPVF